MATIQSGEAVINAGLTATTTWQNLEAMLIAAGYQSPVRCSEFQMQVRSVANIYMRTRKQDGTTIGTTSADFLAAFAFLGDNRSGAGTTLSPVGGSETIRVKERSLGIKDFYFACNPNAPDSSTTALFSVTLVQGS